MFFLILLLGIKEGVLRSSAIEIPMLVCKSRKRFHPSPYAPPLDFMTGVIPSRLEMVCDAEHHINQLFRLFLCAKRHIAHMLRSPLWQPNIQIPGSEHQPDKSWDSH